jgi:hypothetical protein
MERKLFLTSVFMKRRFFWSQNVAQLFATTDERNARTMAEANARHKLPKFTIKQVEVKEIDMDELMDKVYNV